MPSTTEKEELRQLILLLLADVMCKTKILGYSSVLDEDELLHLLMMIESSRYLNERIKIPKSVEWVQSVLPKLDDRRFRSKMRMDRRTFAKIYSYLRG